MWAQQKEADSPRTPNKTDISINSTLHSAMLMCDVNVWRVFAAWEITKRGCQRFFKKSEIHRLVIEHLRGFLA